MNPSALAEPSRYGCNGLPVAGTAQMTSPGSRLSMIITPSMIKNRCATPPGG
jgi:hypothetical protein